MNRPEEMGQPYTHILKALDDEKLYTATSVAIFATDHGLLAGKESIRIELLRIRILCGRLARNVGFPINGDGKQSGVSAWFGKRWKKALRHD